MWAVTTIGFFSIVQKPWDALHGTLTVRARVKEDLENLKAYLPEMGEISESLNSDYRYRAVAPRPAVMEAMAKLAGAIDYDNFKDAVADRQGHARAAIYGEVWRNLYQLQTSRKPKLSAPPILISAEPVHGKHSRRSEKP